MTTLVWFKRDLRIDDHGPLTAAAELNKAVIPLYIVEPDYWQLPDTSARQWAFIEESLEDLRRQLRGLGTDLLVLTGNARDVLAQLHRSMPFRRVFCHQETGGHWTFERDKAVIGWCQEQNIEFREWQPYGVVRRLQDRDLWDGAWNTLMKQALLPPPDRLAKPEGLERLWQPMNIPDLADSSPCPDRQMGGSQNARKLLGSFLERRCVGYQYNISSPLTAVRACSRLSPHLAYGTLSVREVYQAAKATGTDASSLPRKKRSLTSFRSRLHWHCHFIQKLEDEPELEFRAMHRELEQLKTAEDASERLQRWQEGETGWPLVDASMRALQHTGWINFRMRAMLMAVASYHLWLHWRAPALHLARQFTDFEPGIHYPQAQMQSGLTGINVWRIYNPVLQSQKLDPEGEFIRRWVPELQSVPTEFIHTPWLMTRPQRARYGGNTYIAPVCNHEQAARAARKAMGAFYKARVSREETQRVLARHGSRKGPAQRRPRPSSNKTPADSQLSLFD
ncbi:deoxyribodipyrimidine photo-lyase [Marinobacter sp. chi1]|uniref:Deoxyribodipyrimidine photo-lyase n=1 Tax=Marinobacter suaedae TaxID=3057675 RepID=A0ABT8VXU6_9GAMM|nr:deoxyribodipyrimidine photo-lyase [Marinobacter sp. chi1]MDO3720758.1 deoxyribodipyrimidine photo-lyase [Marinobacter sp. chi1]